MASVSLRLVIKAEVADPVAGISINVCSKDPNRHAELFLSPNLFWTEEQEEDFRWILETYTTKDALLQGRAETITRKLTAYKRRLCEAVSECDLTPKHGSLQLDVMFGSGKTSIFGLHWELLEDVSCWPKGYTLDNVAVCRVFDGHASTAIPLSIHLETMTILLVTARSSSTDDAGYCLISRPLAQTVGMLATEGINVRLEVVSPPTFGEFKAHLRRKRSGFYHSVHFDMHGACEKDSGRYFLYFSSTHGDLVPIPATEVAHVLSQRGIKSVILNACESAVSTSNESTNLAELLMRMGCSAVVAMTRKISETAASVFMVEFYRAMLQSNCTLVEATAKARRKLLLSPHRKARFGLELAVPDSTVPVLYQSENCEPFINRPGLAISKKLSVFSFLATFMNSIQPTSESPGVWNIIGRDAVIRHIERMLFHSGQNLISIVGPAGCGKTAIIDYLAWYWHQSNQVGHVLRYDLAEDEQFTFAKLLHDIRAVQQLPRHVCIEDILKKLNLRQSPRCLIILDNMDTLSNSCIPAESHRSARDLGERRRISAFIERLVETRTIVLFGSRTNVESVLDLPSIHEVAITGLSTFASVELARALSEDGSVFRQSAPGTTEHLEKVFELLDGNPALIKALVTGLKGTEIESAKVLYRKLLCGRIVVDAPLKGRMGRLAEYISSLGTGDDHTSLSLPASYWKYIPQDLKTVFHTYGSSPDFPPTWELRFQGDDNWQLALQFDALFRNYCELENNMQKLEVVGILESVMAPIGYWANGQQDSAYRVHPILPFTFLLKKTAKRLGHLHDAERLRIAFVNAQYCEWVMETRNMPSKVDVITLQTTAVHPSETSYYFNRLKALQLSSEYEDRENVQDNPMRPQIAVSLARMFLEYPADIFLDSLLDEVMDVVSTTWKKECQRKERRPMEGLFYASFVLGMVPRLVHPKNTHAILEALAALESEELEGDQQTTQATIWYKLRSKLVASNPQNAADRPRLIQLCEETLSRRIPLDDKNCEDPRLWNQQIALAINTNCSLWASLKLWEIMDTQGMAGRLTYDTEVVRAFTSPAHTMDLARRFMGKVGEESMLDVIAALESKPGLEKDTGWKLSENLSSLAHSVLSKPFRQAFPVAFNLPQNDNGIRNETTDHTWALVQSNVLGRMGQEEKAAEVLERQLEKEKNGANDPQREADLKYHLAMTGGRKGVDDLRLIREAHFAVESSITKGFYEPREDAGIPTEHVCKFHAQSAYQIWRQLKDEGDDGDPDLKDLQNLHIGKALELFPTVADEGLLFYCLNCVALADPVIRLELRDETDAPVYIPIFHNILYLSYKRGEKSFTGWQDDGPGGMVMKMVMACMLEYAMHREKYCAAEQKVQITQDAEATLELKVKLFVRTLGFALEREVKEEDDLGYHEFYEEVEKMLYDKEPVKLVFLWDSELAKEILTARFGTWRDRTSAYFSGHHGSLRFNICESETDWVDDLHDYRAYKRRLEEEEPV